MADAGQTKGGRTKEERKAKQAKRQAKLAARLATMGPVKKIFQIGFNKCGTRSLNHFFEKNGLLAVHWQGGRLALQIQSNVDEGRPALEGLPDAVFYSDLEGPKHHPKLIEAFKLFDRIYEAEPWAYFILNTRNIDKWIASRMNHNLGGYAQRHLRLLGLSSLVDLEEHWRKDWITHHEQVLDFFKDRKNQLLVFDIERHDGTDLVEFFKHEFVLTPRHYRQRGKTKPESERRKAV
ncbi:MAG: hypothetical protein KY449_13775 [Proteobacteria bacterium]|nr:hypothetical protein [Pseudomonadota bacterium]